MKRRNAIWVAIAGLLLLGGCIFVFVLGVYALGRTATGAVTTARSVAVVEVKGGILYGAAPGILGPGGAAYSQRIVEDLERAAADPLVGAIVLDVNSPGGSVVASMDVYRALLEIDKPVVTSMGETAASGGYLIACGTQRVLARPNTLTGSIGVIYQLTNIEDLLDTLGVEITSITSGPMKDLGSPYDPLDDEEVAIFRALVDEAYDQFVQVVVEGRDLPVETVTELADGRVYSGLQAMELGLVDELGDLDDAIARAGELAGIEGEPTIRRYDRQPGLLDILVSYPQTGDLGALRDLLQSAATPRLLYLYEGR